MLRHEKKTRNHTTEESGTTAPLMRVSTAGLRPTNTVYTRRGHVQARRSNFY